MSGCLTFMSWLQIKKIVILQCLCSFILHDNMNCFSIELWRVMNSGFYTTASLVVGARNSKALPKAKLAPQKGHGHYSFLNSSEAIISEKYVQQTEEMHRKLQHLQPVLVNRMGPVLLHDDAWLHVAKSTLQKLNKLGYEGLPYLPSSPDLSPVATDFSFFKVLDNFLQGKCFHSQ